MKATISYEGVRVECEDFSATELQELIFAIRDGRTKAVPRKRPGRPASVESVHELNASQRQTWQYLMAHRGDSGTSATEYAKDAKITHSVADSRLRKLVVLGLATKIAPGRYKAGSADPEIPLPPPEGRND